MASGKLLMTSSSLSNQYCRVTPVQGGDLDLVQFAWMDCPLPAGQTEAGFVSVCAYLYKRFFLFLHLHVVGKLQSEALVTAHFGNCFFCRAFLSVL